MTEPVSSPPAPIGPRERRLIVGSLAIHAVLPGLLAGVAIASTDLVGFLLLLIHLGFPVLLLVTVRRWWARRYDLLILLLLNHLVTFAVIGALATVFG